MSAPPRDSEPLACYAFTPRAFAPEVRLTLRDRTLEVDDMRRKTVIPLAGVARVRLTFEPRGVMTKSFRVKLTGADRRAASFSSLTWRSMIQADNQSESYRAFVAALLAAIARENPACRFLAGRPAPVWWTLALASVALLGGVAFVAATRAPTMQTAPMLVVIAFALLFAWVVVETVVRNRPRVFAADAPPPDLLP